MSSNPLLRTSATASRFSYTPLAGTSGFIRTIKVLPDLQDGLVACQLEHVAVDESTVYTCLSYVWGNAGDDHQILLNGRTFAVRENLHGFLEAARQRFPHPLWIDAISINQSDVLEKNQQVMQMGDIYRNAYWVIAWLGSCPQLDPLVNLDRSIIDEWVRRREEDEDSTEDEGDSEAPSRPLLTLGKEKEVVEALKAARELSAHVYLTRAWIVQEMALAEALHIWTASGETVNAAITLIGSIVWQERHHLAEFHGPDEMEALLDKWDLDSPELMMNILTDCNDYESGKLLDLFFEKRIKCDDPRDRIYSLRALLDGGNTFDVDYQEDLVSLFYRTCNHFGLWYTDRDLALMDLLEITTEMLESDQNKTNYASLPIKIVGSVFEYYQESQERPNGAITKCRNCPLALMNPGHELLLRQSTEDDLTPQNTTFETGHFDVLGCLLINQSHEPRNGHVQFRRDPEGKYTATNGFCFTTAERYEHSRSLIRFGQLTGATFLEKKGLTWESVPYPDSTQAYIDNLAPAKEFRLAISKADAIERSRCPRELRRSTIPSDDDDVI